MAGLIGHIVNHAATGGDRRVEAAPGVILRAPESFSQLDDCLAEMRAAGVQTLLIDGGDGTVREVLSRAPDVWGDDDVRYAITPNGNTNLIARHAGGVSGDDIQRFFAAPGKAKRTVLNVLKAERDGHAPLRGFILGVGAYETATRFAQREIGARHGRQVLETVLWVLRSRELRAPSAMAIEYDDHGATDEDRLLAAFSTFTDPLILRLNPFATTEAGAIRWLDVRADPPRLPLAALWLAMGRRRKWMRDHYRSGASDAVRLELKSGFVMDGERFEVGDGGEIRLSATEAATFLSL